MVELGLLFPTGGRVAPELMIAREGEVEDLVSRLRERTHVLLTGERRIGKTTVCHAAAQRLEHEYGFTVLELETPEQSTAAGFCAHIVERIAMVSLLDEARQAARVARPLVMKLLEKAGIPLDLNQFGAEIPRQTRRGALELPRQLVAETGRPLLLFIDELQRAVSYADGVGLVNDLVDIYSKQDDREVVVLVDGSDERALGDLVGEPYSLAKLTSPRPLPPTIPDDQWRRPLRDRFNDAGLTLPDQHLDGLLQFAAGQPYPMMCAAMAVALRSRQLGESTVGDLAMQLGLEEARGRLDADR